MTVMSTSVGQPIEQVSPQWPEAATNGLDIQKVSQHAQETKHGLDIHPVSPEQLDPTMEGLEMELMNANLSIVQPIQVAPPSHQESTMDGLEMELMNDNLSIVQPIQVVPPPHQEPTMDGPVSPQWTEAATNGLDIQQVSQHAQQTTHGLDMQPASPEQVDPTMDGLDMERVNDNLSIVEPIQDDPAPRREPTLDGLDMEVAEVLLAMRNRG